jgi:hypothetical protein
MWKYTVRSVARKILAGALVGLHVSGCGLIGAGTLSIKSHPFLKNKLGLNQ